MKKRHVLTGLLILVVLSAWSVDELADIAANDKIKSCTGYTIIEYGKGVTCRGDTVSLDKIGGLQVLALHRRKTGTDK